MEKNKRRQFLKNTSLSLLSASILPTIVKAENTTDNFEKDSFVVCNHSTEDAYGQGPFYTANAPNIVNNQLANVNEPGIKIIISGQVFNLECSEVIPNTEIDIWHRMIGFYDNTDII